MKRLWFFASHSPDERALYIVKAGVIIASCWRPWMENKATSLWLNPFKIAVSFLPWEEELAYSNGLRKSGNLELSTKIKYLNMRGWH